MVRSGLVLKEADFNLSAMVLLGIMGSGIKSKEHGIATADMMDKMQPQYLAALTTTAVPGTKLHRDIEKGDFNPLSPIETLEEMRYMIDGIYSDNIKFVGAHASNYLPISGTLQKDKKAMLDIIDKALADKSGSYLKTENQRGL
jgi:histone acetyltransferase (RNA polymerase elongator complex component)